MPRVKKTQTDDEQEEITTSVDVDVSDKLPATPSFNTEFRDEIANKYYRFNGKRWTTFTPPQSNMEPIEIKEKKDQLLEVFAANSWVDGKKVDSDTFIFEVSKGMDKYTIECKAKDLQVTLQKAEKKKRKGVDDA